MRGRDPLAPDASERIERRIRGYDRQITRQHRQAALFMRDARHYREKGALGLVRASVKAARDSVRFARGARTLQTLAQRTLDQHQGIVHGE